jgi:aryl-alcohol dehydrogenase-like predicted oxidoreductase
VIGLGCWQLGSDWGTVSEDDALETLDAAVDAGVTFSTRPTSTATGAASS